MRIGCIFIFCYFLLSNAFSQEVLENNSSEIKWKQVNTPDFRVIFPDGYEREAQRVANTLQTIHEPESLGGKSPKKISIVLRNRNSISNGFVALGPRRSEFYTTPPQDYNFLGTNDWLDLLSLHEYRHIAQFQHSKQGFNKLFYYLFGQNTQTGMAFAAVPQWFWEGDATLIETLNSESGRGRIPEFSRSFKSNLLEKKHFNYNKQYLGSFKDFVPDHYKLGYHFVTHLRRRTNDPKIWDKVTGSAWSTPFVPFTFSNALKKNTGKYLVANYDLMNKELKSEYNKQLAELKPTDFNYITDQKSETFTDYSYPQVLSDGSIVVYKTGIGDVGQLVQINKNGEKQHRLITGITNNTGMLSSFNTTVVWNEFHFDPRWRAKTYSVIKSYNFNTKELKTISEKSRYSGASISPDGSKIVTTLTTVDSDYYLVIIDAKSGNEIKRFENPKNALYTHASWSENGQEIVSLKIDENGKSVIKFDYKDGSETILFPSSNENIGYPILKNDYLYYNSAVNGIDNIYALNLETNERFQITNSRYGAYNPSITDNAQLIYNEHTKEGLAVVSASLDTTQWVAIDQVVNRKFDYFEPLIEQEGHAEILGQVSDKKYPVKKYSKLGHIINIHSWGPFLSTDVTQAEIGIFSKDVLSTTTMRAGYTYDVEEETGFVSAGISYQGLFPIIDFDIEYGNRKSSESFRDFDGNIVDFDFNWKETSISGGLRVPLILTKSKFRTSFTIANSVRLTKVTSFENSFNGGGRIIGIQNETDTTLLIYPDAQDNGTLINNVASLSYNRLLKTSKRDIVPQWGQYGLVEHWSSPYGGDYNSGLFAVRLGTYFPSPLQFIDPYVFKHHAFNFRYAYQYLRYELSVDSYHLRNRIPKPRGLSYPTDNHFHSASANYIFPLWYPDIALGPILNIQRLRSNLFYDFGYGQLTTNGRSATYQSFGIDLLIDFNIMRFKPLFAAGTRLVYNFSSPYEAAGLSVEILLANISL